MDDAKQEDADSRTEAGKEMIKGTASRLTRILCKARNHSFNPLEVAFILMNFM